MSKLAALVNTDEPDVQEYLSQSGMAGYIFRLSLCRKTFLVARF